MVKGKISPSIESIDYSDLSTLESCENAFDQILSEKNIVFFPNPTFADVKIKNFNPETPIKNIELKIFDSIGRELIFLRNEEGILPDEIWEIDFKNFPPGFYVFKFSSESLEKTVNIVKH